MIGVTRTHGELRYGLRVRHFRRYHEYLSVDTLVYIVDVVHTVAFRRESFLTNTALEWPNPRVNSLVAFTVNATTEATAAK